MAKTWVLDTETKGTGAEMVPLEKVQERAASKGRRPAIAPARKPRRAPAPAPRGPRRFRVVDVMSGRVLTEDADTRATLEVLRGVRSNVDVRVYTWEPDAERWEPLLLAEQKLLWERREGL